MRKLLSFLVVILLAGCGLVPAEITTPEPPPPAATPSPSPVSPTPTTAPASRNLNHLSIWVPAEYDPAKKSASSLLLEKSIKEFTDLNPGVTVDIRVKADSGPASLLESLVLTAAAAPDAMPSIALLNRSQMEEIAKKGIIFPYNELTATLDETDWFPYAKELATVQNSFFGMPLSGDSLVLVSRSTRAPAQTPTWEDVIKAGSSVLFAAADPLAAVPLALYRSAGGSTQDSQQLPQIQSVEFEKTLTLLADGAEKNVFPNWLINYQTDRQALDVFNNQQGGWVITWLSNILPGKPTEINIYPVPSLDSGSATYASGSVWVLADTNPERRPMSVKLAEYLTRSEFLSKWNLANNSLPPRPSALAAWPDTPLRAQLNQVALASQLRPPSEIMASLGPAVQEATVLILKKQSDPARAAKTAQERLAAPAAK